ncbi:MAG TPA: response regulator [Gammaproteobacteria bacterium]
MRASRIMVVDGSGVTRELVTRILVNTIEQAEIVGCGSGREALARLGAERYNLVTTALVLPDMDGLDFCRTIRQTPGHQHVPMIVISGDAEQRLLREGFAAGVTDYFDKSLGYPAFGAFIKDFCRRNSGLVGRVLYVEDSTTAAAILLRLLERHGLQVTHVTSAEQALVRLEAMRAGREGYDLVITDFHLGEAMNGGDLLHAVRVRYHFTREQLPVLMMTGNDDLQTQIESFHAGANDFVQKPLVEEILMARVRSLLLIRQQYDALHRFTEECAEQPVHAL